MNPVAVGTRNGAADDRARRRALAPAVRADVDAAVRHRADQRRRHSEPVRLGGARQRPDQRRHARRRSSDPGKPSFRIGYTELKVEDATKRLTVGVTANRPNIGPPTRPHIDLDVKDAAGKPASAEVTLWAVDYGVLSLTAFHTPDVLRSVYVEKSLQVTNTDNRQRLVSRRATVPKGEESGGGGGDDQRRQLLRKDFQRARLLARFDCHRTPTAKRRAPTSSCTSR
jgi:hypothetical protein